MTFRTGDHTPRLEREIQDFILERRIRKVSKSTLSWHKTCLARFATFCYDHEVTATQQITANLLRHFVMSLEEAGHNPGGLANIYRSVKAYLNWFEIEYDDLNWRNPARKVKVSLPKIEALDPISLEDFNKLLATCERKTLAGDRDRALLFLMLDTGARKAEVTALNVDDIDLNTGAVQIRKGKGGKARTVFIGATARRAMLAYLRQREAYLLYLARTSKAKPTVGLWVGSIDGKKLNQDGIRQILRRRANDAGIPEPSPHSFRRAFALNSLRNGMDLLALQRLLGHADLSVINRYVKLVDSDLQVAHEKHGVVDNL